MNVCNVCKSNSQKLEYTFDDYNIMKCMNCSVRYIDQNSLKIKPEDLYKDDYFTEKHIKFFSDYNDIIANKKTRKLKNFEKRLKKLKELGAGKKLLDIGCGQGTFLYLSKKYGFLPAGCDISKYSKKFVEKKFNINVYNGIEKIPKNEKFDVITMLDFIEHTTDPNEVLDIVKNITKNNGLVLIQTPNGKSLLHILANAIYKLSLGKIKIPAREVFHMYHNYHFTKQNIEKMLNNRGFEIIEYKKDNLPLHTVEGNNLKMSLIAFLYFLSRLSGKQIDMIITAKKVNSDT